MAEPVETAIGTVTADHFRPASVRHRVAVGPKALYALFAPGDAMHPVVRAFMAFLRDGDLPYRRVVATDHAVDEAATRLKKRASQERGATMFATLDDSALYRLDVVGEDVVAEAAERFADWEDHGGSFTDFVVAAHADAEELDHVLSFDRHLEAFDVTTVPYRTYET
jgi:hypothetical protein